MRDEAVTDARSTAPVDTANTEAQDADDEEMPSRPVTKKAGIVFGLFVIGSICFLYFVLPQVAGLQDTWNRIEQGKPWWLVLCLVFETCAFLGYVTLFRTIFARGNPRIDLKVSYQINLAALAATRLFAAAGAGGIALTAWALRRSGMERRIVACRMVAFLAVLYSIYMLALVVVGFGLYLGVFPGPAPFAMTVVPAIFGAIVIGLFFAVALLPGDFERRIANWATHESRSGRIARRLAAAPASMASGIRTAIRLVRDREVGLLGAVAWWTFDMATLWAAFHAFGEAPPWPVVMLGYFVGLVANTLPVPGGIGGVEGGMIGAFAALGVNAGLAVVAVLTYRAFSFWLPTIPGVIAYFQLRKTVARWRALPRLERAPRDPRIDSMATIQSEVKH